MVEWTPIIVAAIGIIAAGVGGWAQRKRASPDRRTEDRVAHETDTPASPSTRAHDVEAIRLANQAMSQVTKLSEQLEESDRRLTEVEAKLGFLQRSYRQLYWWAQSLIDRWDELSDQPDPPDLPDDIHHPD